MCLLPCLLRIVRRPVFTPLPHAHPIPSPSAVASGIHVDAVSLLYFASRVPLGLYVGHLFRVSVCARTCQMRSFTRGLSLFGTRARICSPSRRRDAHTHALVRSCGEDKWRVQHTRGIRFVFFLRVPLRRRPVLSLFFVIVLCIPFHCSFLFFRLASRFPLPLLPFCRESLLPPPLSFLLPHVTFSCFVLVRVPVLLQLPVESLAFRFPLPFSSLIPHTHSHPRAHSACLSWVGVSSCFTKSPPKQQRGRAGNASSNEQLALSLFLASSTLVFAAGVYRRVRQTRSLLHNGTHEFRCLSFPRSVGRVT